MSMKIFFSLRTQFSNLGDLVINRLLVKEALDSGNLFLDVNGVPDWYLNLILKGVDEKAVLNNNRIRYYLLLILVIIQNKSKVVVILKPGGYMACNSKRMLLTRFLQGIQNHVVVALGGRVLRAPSSQQNSKGLGFLVDRFRLSPINNQLIRDEFSCDELKRLGFDSTFTHDMAVLLFLDEVRRVIFPNSLIKNRKKIENNNVVFSFRERSWMHSTYMASTIKKMDKSYDSIFVSQVFSDNKLNAELADSTDSKIVTYDGSERSIIDVANEYIECKYVVSNRLHVLMIAASFGAIPIAIVSADDEKVRSFMVRIGMEGNVFTSEEWMLMPIDTIIIKSEPVNATLMKKYAGELKETIRLAILNE